MVTSRAAPQHSLAATIEYLQSCSIESTRQLELSRLGELHALKGELVALTDRIFELETEAALARFSLEMRLTRKRTDAGRSVRSLPRSTAAKLVVATSINRGRARAKHHA